MFSLDQGGRFEFEVTGPPDIANDKGTLGLEKTLRFLRYGRSSRSGGFASGLLKIDERMRINHKFKLKTQV